MVHNYWSHTHVRTHETTHTRTYMHTRTHTHTHTPTHMHARACTHLCMHADMHTQLYMYTYVCIWHGVVNSYITYSGSAGFRSHPGICLDPMLLKILLIFALFPYIYTRHMVQTGLHDLNSTHVLHTCMQLKLSHTQICYIHVRCVCITQECGNLLFVHTQWSRVATLDFSAGNIDIIKLQK